MLKQRVCQSWDLRGLGTEAGATDRAEGRSHRAEEVLEFNSQYGGP